MNFKWNTASPEQMLKHMKDLHLQLLLVTALLEHRDTEYDLSSDTSRRRIAEAEALLKRQPEGFQEAQSDAIGDRRADALKHAEVAS